MMWPVLAAINLVLGSTLLYFAFRSNNANIDSDILFNEFVAKYNKSYTPGTEEYTKRLLIFEESLKRIEWLNKQRDCEAAAIYGITKFTDLTPEEFQVHVLKNQQPKSIKLKNQHVKREIKETANLNSIPKKIDWREKKVVTSVKNQDKCGACWAFSTIETIETMYAKKFGVLEEWSVQQLIDCAPEPNAGCEGGDTCVTVEWLIQEEVSVVLAKEYPYAEESGTCKFKLTGKVIKVSSNFTCERFVGEEQLMLYLLASHGPLTVAVDASGWQDYLGGIIQFHCEDEQNHAVQIVGYDLTGDVPYYIVRNSWGTEFGHDGYLYIAFNENMCGIAEEVVSLDVVS